MNEMLPVRLVTFSFSSFVLSSFVNTVYILSVVYSGTFVWVRGYRERPEYYLSRCGRR